MEATELRALRYELLADRRRGSRHEPLNVLTLALDRAIERLERDEGGAGVREPAPPAPESPGDAIALDDPEAERFDRALGGDE